MEREPHYRDAAGLTTVYHGDCRQVMVELEAESVDAIVTDPPYGLEFMGAEWDAPWKYGFSEMGIDGHRKPTPQFGSSRNPVCRTCHKHKRGTKGCRCAVPDFDETPADASRLYQRWCETWAPLAFRALKPGGHLVAFGGTRTHHRLMCAIEDAGFEMRDAIGNLGLHGWVFGSGFPKSKNLDGQHAGWGTALKPAWEPIILARKPLSESSVAANVLRHGTGGLNIDGCRIGVGKRVPGSLPTDNVGANGGWRYGAKTDAQSGQNPGVGRWPANVVLSHSPECVEAGTRRVKTHWGQPTQRTTSASWLGTRTKAGDGPIGFADADGYETVTAWTCAPGCAVAELDASVGECSYNPAGVFSEDQPAGWPGGKNNIGRQGEKRRSVFGYGDRGGPSRFFYTPKASKAERQGVTHPTVKPVDLMRWLCRLVTPPGGLVLDPFAGSGTTRLAALAEGFRVVLIEQNAKYLDQLCGRAAQVGLPLDAEPL